MRRRGRLFLVTASTVVAVAALSPIGCSSDVFTATAPDAGTDAGADATTAGADGGDATNEGGEDDAARAIDGGSPYADAVLEDAPVAAKAAVG